MPADLGPGNAAYSLIEQHLRTCCIVSPMLTRILLEEMVNPDEPNTIGLTPLASAALVGRHEVIRWLIECGADVNGTGLTGLRMRPIFAACMVFSNDDSVSALLEARAHQRSEDDGATPLMVAAVSGRHETVRILIEARADMNEAGPCGITALCLAARHGWEEVTLSLIRAAADVDKAMQGGITPLWLAMHGNHLDAAELVIEAGADTNQSGWLGYTPLHLASVYGSRYMASLLLEARADADAVTVSGRTALIIAASWGHTDVVLSLIGGQANLEHMANTGSTAYSCAVSAGHGEIADLLAALDLSADQQSQSSHATQQKDVVVCRP